MHDIWDETLVILCWFYVNPCIFEHTTDKIFKVTDYPAKTRASLATAPPPLARLQGEGARTAPVTSAIMNDAPDVIMWLHSTETE